MLPAMLRGSDKHFHQIVVKAVENLPLKRPLKLWIVQVPWMEFEVVNMNRRVGEARPDYDFHRFALGAGVELHQRMLVQAKLLLHARESVAHSAIVAEPRLLVP